MDDTVKRKPRVAKAPQKTEIAHFGLELGEVKKLYRLMDKSGKVGELEQALYVTELVNSRYGEVQRGDELVVEIVDIRHPRIFILRQEAPKLKAPRKPRTPKALAESDAVEAPKAPRKPRTPKA